MDTIKRYRRRQRKHLSLARPLAREVERIARKNDRSLTREVERVLRWYVERGGSLGNDPK